VKSLARSRTLPLAGLALTLLVAAPLAFAGEEPPEPTREGYVARVEPVCKRSAAASKRILKGVKRQVTKNRLGPAGRRVIRASGVLARAARQIAAVPRPAADAATLAKWVRYLKLQGSLLGKIGRALMTESRGLASRYAKRLNHFNSLANNTVIGFGFHECQANSSPYL
jgi:hypothetical protein